MGTKLANKISRMSLWSKIGIVFMLLTGIFVYQGVFKPGFLNSATNTYYFTTDTTAVNVGTDGSTSTSTSTTPNKMISMKTGVYTTSRSVVAASNTTEQTMVTAYGPLVTSSASGFKTITAPAITIGVRDRNGTSNNITWKAYLYDYTPSGGASTLRWTSDAVEAHPSVQTPQDLKFTNPQPFKIATGHRLKLVIKCQMANTASSARLYWGNSTNYSFFTFTEADYVPNSVMVTNLADYYSGSLTNVTQGDTKIPMLKFDMYYSESAGSATWSGGKLDKIGNNTNVYVSADEPGDVTFYIYKDADGDGVFESTDTMVGGPYRYNDPASGTFVNPTENYTLTTAQTITATPQRYFVVYDILRTALPSTTVGAQIVSNSYFTSNASGGVQNVSSTPSSTPNIDFGGVAISKVYKADWDDGLAGAGTSLSGIAESGGPSVTDSACVTRSTNVSPTKLPLPLVGLINYPAHSCTSVAGQGYLNNTGSTQSDFIRLYFGGVGYPSDMKAIKGTSFTYRVSSTSAGTVTLQLFYVTSTGVRVNAPISSTYTTGGTNTNQAVTTSLAGQNFTDVPKGARLGIQIGVTNNVRICLGSTNGMTGSSAGANLTVQETAAENENVDVGNGTIVPNATVYAGDTVYDPINGTTLNGKSIIIDSFTLNSAKPKSVTAITLTGNAMFNSTNIKNVRLYQDTGVIGVVDGDTQKGSTLPGSSIINNSISFTGLSLAIKPTVQRFLVVVDIADVPNVNVILKALVSGVTVANDAISGLPGFLGNNSDSSSATLTIQPTTSLTDGAAEPASKIINSMEPATLIDAFGIKTNGGLNDQINTVTVTLSTTSSVAAGYSLSDYVSKVEIVNSTNTSVYGHLTSPTYRDTNEWQVATSGLYATAGTTQCYVRVTPKANLGGTYVVKANVTSLTHIRTINKLMFGDDDTSASITLDGAAPNNPGNFTATTATNAAAISLNWDVATDASGSAVTYTIVRGLGNAPVPMNCTPVAGKVFQVYQGAHPGSNPDVYDTVGLEEGQSYSYRACSTDSVGNTSIGSTATTTAGIINRCDKAPTLEIKPSATFIKAGETKELMLSVINKDTGVCGSASTFHLSITGTPNTTDFDAPTFQANDFVVATNGGSKYLKLYVTAKAGAPYQAMDHFNVQVNKSGASVATVVHADPIHVVVNKYGSMMHSSMQLGTTKFGQWGADYDCSTCHREGSNIKRISDYIDTPTGKRPVVFTTISAPVSVTSGVMGNDTRVGNISTNVCEVCHHNARFHQYSSSKVTWKTHNNSSDCMRCHDHRIGFKTLAEGLSCDNCHGYPPIKKDQLVVPPTNVLYPYVTGDDAGAHSKHNDRKLNCQTCHNNGNHFLTAQPDTKVNMGFSIRSSHFSGFNPNVIISTGTLKSVAPVNDYTYQADTGTTIGPAFDKIMTCSVYCHGYWNNSYTTSGGYNTEPAWSGTTQTGCGSCHGASGSQPTPTGSHSKHAGTLPGYGNGIACTKCHGFRNYSTTAAHINGNVEWDLSTITTSATYRGVNKGSTGAIAPTAPGSYGSCANLYCHSNVQSAGGTAGPTTYGNPTWGGSVTCGSCHTHSSTGGHVSGGHSQHTAPPDVEGFDCRICHGSGGDANSLNHANGKINFLFGGLAENTHYSYSSSKIPGSGAYGNCYNSDCHGRRTITWGPPTGLTLCNKCHTTNPTAAGFYGTGGPSSTTSNTDPYVGAHFQHITSMPFKLSAKLDCSQCHVKPTDPYSPGHIDTALPAEINFGTLAASGAQNGYSSASHQPSYNYTSKQCSNVWCHGAGMNSNEGTGPYGSVGPVGQGMDGGTLGAPDAKSAIWNSPYLATAADKCQTCHASPPPAPESGYTHFDDDTAAPYARNKCTNCHRELNANATGFTQPQLHVNGIIDSCYVCHGRPPVDDETLTKPAIGALNIGMVGAHQAHRLNPAIGNDCSACHYNFTYDMPSYKLEIGFRAYGNRITKGVFYGMSTLPSVGYSQPIVYFSTWTSTKVRRTNDTTKLNTCESIYCHGGGTNTLLPLGGGSNIKPNWEAGPSQANCGSCHGVTGDTYRTRGSHGAHVGTGFGEPKLACANCHGVKVNNYHVNGTVEWEFYSTAKRLNQTAGYSGTGYKPSGGSSFVANGNTGSLAPSASYGTCQVYCHSDVSDKSFKIPTWGGPAMTCDSCHKNQTSTGRFSGGHMKHTAASPNGYGIDCAICHFGSGAGNPLHVNGTVNIVFNTAVTGNAVYTPGAAEGQGTCKNVACHVSDASSGPVWNLGSAELTAHPATCVGCHTGEVGVRDAVVPQFGFESHHIQRTSGMVQGTDCAMCHWEGANDGSRNLAYHAGSLTNSGNAVNLVIWPSGTTGLKTPTNRPAVSAATFVSYTANGRRTSISKLNNVCLGCHNSSNAGFKPFNSYSTIRYSWEARSGLTKTSIQSRYSSTQTFRWSNYSTNSNGNALVSFGTNQKSQTTKALSAHGNASKNQMAGWDITSGEDKKVSSDYTYSGAGKNRNVFCADCHNSHGSAASGITSSYSSATGRYKGGILKSTNAGRGGYASSYTPQARTITYNNYSGKGTTSATFNAGANLCNDCHNSMDPSGATLTKPWSIQNTYSSVGNRYKSIGGYWSTPYFDNYTANAALRTVYKQGGAVGGIKDYRKPMGGHFGSSINGTSAAHSGEINGLCTPCHDPHGVTRSLGTNQKYAIPLLKGTWMTTPYKEDRANIIVKRGGGSKVSAFDGGAIPGYHIDQNTLLNMPVAISGGVNTTSTKGDKNGMAFRNLSNSAKKIEGLNSGNKLTVAEFAGLCTTCHNQASLTGSASAPAAASTWKSKERIHQSVNGWAATASGTANTNNKVHAYTCSKCHAPHVSRLPRLMVTNCLDANHLGQKASGGTPAVTPGNQTSVVAGNSAVSVSTAKGAGRFPSGGRNYWTNSASNTNTNNQNPGPWWFQTWKAPATTTTGTLTNPTAAYTTPSTDLSAYSTNCHNATTAGGGSYNWDPTLQRWNNKTEW